MNFNKFLFEKHDLEFRRSKKYSLFQTIAGTRTRRLNDEQGIMTGCNATSISGKLKTNFQTMMRETKKLVINFSYMSNLKVVFNYSNLSVRMLREH